jgi:hypothetical protein
VNINLFQRRELARIDRLGLVRCVESTLGENKDLTGCAVFPFISVLVVMVALFAAALRSESQKPEVFLWQSAIAAGIVIL